MNNRPADWSPEDDDPAYQTPYGKLPTDDQPATGEYVNFAAGKHSDDELDAIEQRMIVNAMIAERTRMMRQPFQILKGMRERLDDVQGEMVISDTINRILTPEVENKNTARNEKRAKQEALWFAAIETWAQELTLAMNETLEHLASQAESRYQKDAEDFAKWMRKQKI